MHTLNAQLNNTTERERPRPQPGSPMDATRGGTPVRALHINP
ncbi:hypothetical protein [Variovorax rhizosphaerae]|uniref:Uncharacterized protein n=1 Tax=Variovorax rhizosphaerae TaxID=1836200 RepID=A0ABU8WS45_9BURK